MCTIPVYMMDEDIVADSICDLCGEVKLRAAYRPSGTKKDLSVYVCNTCGLVQSLPRNTEPPTGGKKPLKSSGADRWYTCCEKAIRTKKAIEYLKETMDLAQIERCLDIGSGSGSFIKAFRELNPSCVITAIEPDPEVAADYEALENVEFLTWKFEECGLPEETFDLIYCCHTLEHAANPTWFLKKAYGLLAPGGVIYIDVPDINLLDRSDFIEEFFIDQHLYHFSPVTLRKFIESTGFEIKSIAEKSTSGGENIAVIARRPETGAAACSGLVDPEEFKTNLSLISSYEKTREHTLDELTKVGEFINSLKSKKVLVWGAGRLFDCLMEHGDIEEGAISGVIDRYLVDFLTKVHGHKLLRPEELSKGDADVVVIMSRECTEEIRAEVAERIGPACAAYDFTTLMGEVRAASNE